jgi:Transcriptional regulator, AbiEi antitoxin
VSPRLSGLEGFIGPEVRTADQVIRELASKAHGVVTRAELLSAGLTADQIKRRRERGLLLPTHRGVYRVGHHAPSLEARYIAAVKACGDNALLAGRAAAYLWRLIKGSPPKPEVLTPNDRRVKGVHVRRARSSELPRVVIKRGIPVTNVPQTLVDLASSLPEEALARACHEAGVLYKTTPKQVDAVLERHPNAPGRRKLERVIYGEVPVTLSRLESRFLVLLRKAGLPLPVTNRTAGGHRVDCRWPEQRLTVELDSYRYHNSHYSWDKDRLREREARRRGDELRRYTSVDVFEEPGSMLAELAELLGRPKLGAI